ncbi:hypothetical protein [Geodermatophilus normandii]|uniref:hypothetical protein n=1 Tax=Geodermatophilus normandii TaxID=1137989 RepID=UPI001EF78040
MNHTAGAMSGMPPQRQVSEHEALVMALAAGSADRESRCVEPSCVSARVLNHGLDGLDGVTSGSVPVSIEQATGGWISATGRAATSRVGTPKSVVDHAVLSLLAVGEGSADEEGKQRREEQPAGQNQPEHRISTFWPRYSAHP